MEFLTNIAIFSLVPQACPVCGGVAEAAIIGYSLGPMAAFLGFFAGTVGAALYLLPFMFVFTMVIFFHELGHFSVGRLFGMQVRSFSIGIGRELVGLTDRWGTRWKISLLPLGGYVMFLGEGERAPLGVEEAEGAFFSKSVFARIAVLASGLIANFILAIVIFTGIFWTAGVKEAAPIVSWVEEAGPAAKAGILVGDRLARMDGSEIRNFKDAKRIMGISAGQRLAIEVSRDDERLLLYATPELRVSNNSLGSSYEGGALGIVMTAQAGTETVRQSFSAAFLEAVRETGQITWLTLRYLGGVLIGQHSADQLGGPVRIAELSSEVAKKGIGALLALTAILSISLGIVNFLPIPLLNGGHILFHLVEAVRGRPLPQSVQTGSLVVGGIILLAVMSFVTINDILRLL